MLIVKFLAAWFALSILFAWGWARFWNRTEPIQGE